MVAEQRGMKIPAALISRCPKCGAPMSMNLRCDSAFVQDAGWCQAASRYTAFLHRLQGRRVLFLELGVGGNTPVIIKYPFWQMTHENPAAVYACINLGEAVVPPGLADRAICINGDISAVFSALLNRSSKS